MFDKSNICDNPAIICRTCFQYCNAENPCIPVNSDDTCLSCLSEAAELLKAHVKEKETAHGIVHGMVAPTE